MRCLSIVIFALVLFSLIPDCQAQTQPDANTKSSRLRVAIVGLVHGHVSGFLPSSGSQRLYVAFLAPGACHASRSTPDPGTRTRVSR